MYFQYGDTEINYLKRKDKKLAWAIEQIGHIERKLDADLFAAVVRHIVGQQISSKAQATVWARIEARLTEVTPATVHAASAEELQSLGISLRKAEYIKDFADKIVSGEFDLQAVEQMSDAEAITALSSLKGIGKWTAEMILLFCLQRPDILSYDDLAIQRGLRISTADSISRSICRLSSMLFVYSVSPDAEKSKPAIYADSKKSSILFPISMRNLFLTL